MPFCTCIGILLPSASMPRFMSSHAANVIRLGLSDPGKIRAARWRFQQSIIVENISLRRPSTLRRFWRRRCPTTSSMCFGLSSCSPPRLSEKTVQSKSSPSGMFAKSSVQSPQSCVRHHKWATALEMRSILPRSSGALICLKAFSNAPTAPVLVTSTECMKANRSVCAKEKSSPRNSPNWIGSTGFCSKNWLRSVGWSWTMPVATKKAKP
mmetsp:Transcript_132758/g.331199  ORF Transcript_132758/g.331199 Transcript_132758/m.331199 type:complete len:210 (+) Transcript_132758:209-838(+)